MIDNRRNYGVCGGLLLTCWQAVCCSRYVNSRPFVLYAGRQPEQVIERIGIFPGGCGSAQKLVMDADNYYN